MRLEKAKIGRGLTAASDSLTIIPKEAKLRPLRDQLIVEPLDTVYSTRLIVKSDTKPMRGIVRAAGPGHYPAYYLDKDGDRIADHKRSQRAKKAHGEQFMPTEVKVGDTVYLGGMESGGYSFDTFLWGDTLMLHCTERDVAGIESAR